MNPMPLLMAPSARRARRTNQVLLAVFALAAFASAGGCTKGGAAEAPASATAPKAVPVPASPAAAPAAAQSDATPDKVVVYYFHGDRRCRTCLGIQETISRTVNERFGAELAAGTLAFAEVNFEEPENAHFVKTYELSFSTMVVTAQKGQSVVKWENCGKVWDYAHEPEVLTSYTEKQIRTYLALLKGK